MSRETEVVRAVFVLEMKGVESVCMAGEAEK